VGLVHTAVHRYQKPTLLIAQLDDPWVFYAPLDIATIALSRKVRSKDFDSKARQFETFSIRTENVLKKQDARFSVFSYQSGLMLA